MYKVKKNNKSNKGYANVYAIQNDKSSTKIDTDTSSVDKAFSNSDATFFFGKITDIFESHVKVMIRVNGVKEWVYVSRSAKRWKKDKFHTAKACLPNDIILYVGTFVTLQLIHKTHEGYVGDKIFIIKFECIPEYQYRFFADSNSYDTYYWQRRFMELQKKLMLIYSGTRDIGLKEFIGDEYGNISKSIFEIYIYIYIFLYYIIYIYISY